MTPYYSDDLVTSLADRLPLSRHDALCPLRADVMPPPHCGCALRTEIRAALLADLTLEQMAEVAK